MSGKKDQPRNEVGQFMSPGGERRPAAKAPARKAAAKKKTARRSASKKSIKWTREKEAVFFRELAMVCNVSAALRKARLTGCSSLAYERRKTDMRFRASWEEAIDQSYAMLELEMLERVRFGDDRPPPATEAEKRLRSIPTALALQLLRLYENRVKARTAAPATRACRGPAAGRRADRMAQRREFEAMLLDFNRRMGGQG
ncbi:MAG TPA: hypothetical protein VFQ67_01820 [Allosphingosinicella sp.]|nr:hypothetical protein [Allosphingosinicella sp.]